MAAEAERSSSPEKQNPWEVAAAAGIDMSLLESNLRKTPAERLAAHDRALAMARMLRDAMLQQRSEKNDQNTH